MEVVGQVFSGEHGNILVRQKKGGELEIGELLVAEGNNNRFLLQVFNLVYSSQMEGKRLELLSGLNIEGYDDNVNFLEEELRMYVVAQVKAILELGDKSQVVPKRLPKFFSKVRRLEKGDLYFLEKPKNPIYIGRVRSGSKVIDADVFIDGEKGLSHHILIPATTGRGKSNLVKVMLHSTVGRDYAGILVLDAHDEYYGRNGSGLKDHPESGGNVFYYSPNPVKGGGSLIINLGLVKPWHFDGIVNFSEAQKEFIYLVYSMKREEWIGAILTDSEMEAHMTEGKKVMSQTINVVRRKLESSLGLQVKEKEIINRSGVFSLSAKGESTVGEIVGRLEHGKKVIIDTSRLTNKAELLVGSIIGNEVLSHYWDSKMKAGLRDRPVISVVLEEAPRVLGRTAVEEGGNIYSTIAREGRKFKVGLIAITQLTSEIPRDVLANMNTKIILGNEMRAERDAIISSAAQDLGDDSKSIASLDKGEAIVSSSFTKFAIPVKVPLFEEVLESKGKKVERIHVVG